MKACSAEELVELGLGAPPPPVVPKNLVRIPVRQRMKALQVGIGQHGLSAGPWLGDH